MRKFQQENRETLKTFLRQELLPYIQMPETIAAYADDDIVRQMIDKGIIGYSDICTIFKTKGDSPVNLDALINAIANNSKNTDDLFTFVQNIKR